MKHWTLSPPLDEIESRLFGVSTGLIQAVDEGRTSERIARHVRHSMHGCFEHDDQEEPELQESLDAVAHLAPPLPGALMELIERRVAAARAHFAPLPASGQIVEIRQIITPRRDQLDWIMQVPLYVLLDIQAELPEIWHGWLVSGEADYATQWDFVLQAQDQPFDPEAAMVQVWNPVRLYLPMAARVVGQLKPHRVQAVRALAAEFLTRDAPESIAPSPGRVFTRVTDGGLRVATGTPIVRLDDPRYRYQRVYFHAAEAIREPARLMAAELARSPSRLARWMHAWRDRARELGEPVHLAPTIAVPMGTSVPHESPPAAHPAEMPAPDAMRPSSGLMPMDEANPDMPHSESHALALENAAPYDLVWRHEVRVRVLDLPMAEGGRLMILPGTEVVKAAIHIGDLTYDQTDVNPGGQPQVMSWDIDGDVVLTLTSSDGHELTLPLYPASDHE